MSPYRKTLVPRTALREDGRPAIVAPHGSAGRMAIGIGEAAALGPKRWYEAPEVVERVSDGGDSARRFGIVGAAGI